MAFAPISRHTLTLKHSMTDSGPTIEAHLEPLDVVCTDGIAAQQTNSRGPRVVVHHWQRVVLHHHLAPHGRGASTSRAANPAFDTGAMHVQTSNIPAQNLKREEQAAIA